MPVSESPAPRPGPQPAPDPTLSPIKVAYEHGELAALLGQRDVLAVFGFGAAAPASAADPRYLCVRLEPAAPPAPFEVWRGAAAVTTLRDGALRAASNGDYCFGAIELDEAAHGGLVAASEFAYRRLCAFVAGSATPQVLRIWNYIDAINDGAGDAERYKAFCSGRACGMGQSFATGYPAATAIGTGDGRRQLQVYWLAARASGTPLENPRQTSAWQYPRQYGPSAPGFARALLAPTQPPQLLISGTASVVGHQTLHVGDLERQLDETLHNLDSLLGVAATSGAARRFGAGAVLKAYVRRRADMPALERRLRAHLPAEVELLLLQGDICRADLLVEIDGVQVG